MMQIPSIAQNTFPTSGNVGINTTTPSAGLDVNSRMKVDSTAIFKDTVSMQKKLTLEQDIKVKGASVFVGDGKFKNDLKILGTTKMDGNAKAFGNFYLKSEADTTINYKRLLSINPNGKISIAPITLPPDDTYNCNYTYPWALADLTPSTTDVVLCPNFTNIGIGTTVPDPNVRLHIVGNELVTKLGIGNADANDLMNFGTSPELYVETVVPAYNKVAAKFTEAQNKSIFFVPKLDNEGYSKLSVKNDAGIFWTDNTTGASPGNGFVLAPQTGGNLGMRIDNNGRFGFNVQPQFQAQYTFGSNSQTTMVVGMGNTPGQNYGLRALAINPTDFVITVATDADVTSNTDVFRVMGNGHVYATEVIVSQAIDFPDYVFAKDYNLMSLDKLESYINLNNHLPNMPTAKEVEKNGASLGKINRVLVEKVEELTLYTIEQQKMIDYLVKEVEKLKKSE